ncbi:MAG: C-GCAxxG-C-C family protein [Thermoleophilia bacterium]
MKSKNEEKKSLSRRELLVGAGKITAAGSLVAMTGGSLGLLAGCGDSSTTTTATSKTQGATLPWPYVKLDGADVIKIQEIAHDDWFVGFCAFATMSGIVNMLREKVGDPYNSFPVEAITYAHGGTAGWGGTCGTLIGAGMAASLAAGPKVGEEILNEVMRWYTETELPVYKPVNPKAQIKSVSKSDSPLCHLSVGKWMKKEGVGFLSPQQMERCARLSSDVAAKTVEYLNAKVDSKFVAANKEPVAVNGLPSQNNCMDCHGTNVPPVPTPGGGENLIQSH